MDWEARIKIGIAACVFALIIAGGIFVSTRPVEAPAPQSSAPAPIPDQVSTPAAQTSVPDPVVPTAPAPIEREGLSIAGVVVDSDDQPIADARVAAYHKDRGATDTQTNEDGAFEIWGLESGDYNIMATKALYNDADLRGIPAGHQRAVLRLTQTSSISGIVLDAASGEPVTSYDIASLDSVPEDVNFERYVIENDSIPWKTIEDAEGEFLLNDVTSDTTTAVGVQSTGYAHTFVEVEPIPSGETYGPIVIELPAEALVQGHVLAPDSSPAVNAAIFAGPKPDGEVLAYAGDDGAFTIEGLNSGQIQLTAEHPDYLPATIDLYVVSERSNTADIRLGQGGTIQGTVWLGDEPRAGVRINLTRMAGPFMNANVESDANGEYKFQGIAPGPVTALAYLSEGYDQQSQPVDLQSEAVVVQGETTTVDFHFPLNLGAIVGTVSIAGDPPVSAVLKGRIVTATGEATFRAIADQTGQFENDAVPAGSGWLDVSAVGADDVVRKRRVEITLQENELLTIDIELAAGAKVSGSVLGLAEGEDGGVWVFPGERTFEQIDAEVFMSLSSSQVALDANGNFEIDGLQPGTYTIATFTISVHDDTGDDVLNNFRADWQTITITGDEDLNVDLSLLAP